MTVLVTINSNNPAEAGFYSTVDEPTMLTTLSPIVAAITGITPTTVGQAVSMLTIAGRVTFLAYQ